ncbi:hypothetical protein BT93_J1403 [Corymbia citriodora subsp. variegata]|nr:hypothetical protein BT93_J1403 [Corymbia citriodora subsp. variegata]
MATSLFFPSSSSPHISILKLKPFSPLIGSAVSSPVASPLSTSSQRTVKGGLSLRASERNPRARSWRLRAAAEDALESSQQIVSSAGGDDGVSTVVSVLLLIAFAGLSILTIGVIYIAVTDFLQKREREKFEKEEAGKKKKSGKKGRVRARAGPRGFGQRIDEDD